VQPRVPTRGERKTAHVFGAVSLEAEWLWQFSPVFNGHTFHLFLLHLIEHFPGRKVFLVIDNGPCHWLDDPGKAWLATQGDRIELHRLPPYSPEFNPVEGCWKATRREATHNRYYANTVERDAALAETFSGFQTEKARVDGHVRRYRMTATE
jgi:transposase